MGNICRFIQINMRRMDVSIDLVDSISSEMQRVLHKLPVHGRLMEAKECLE